MDLKGLTKALDSSHSKSDAHAKSASHARINLLGATAAHAKRSATSQHEKLVEQAKTLVAQTSTAQCSSRCATVHSKARFSTAGEVGRRLHRCMTSSWPTTCRGGGQKLVNAIVHHIEAANVMDAHAAAVKQRVNYPKKVM